MNKESGTKDHMFNNEMNRNGVQYKHRRAKFHEIILWSTKKSFSSIFLTICIDIGSC